MRLRFEVDASDMRELEEKLKKDASSERFFLMAALAVVMYYVDVNGCYDVLPEDKFKNFEFDCFIMR